MTHSESFTTKWNGKTNALVTECMVFPHFDPNLVDPKQISGIKYNCIWDTGATTTAITSNVVRGLGLVATGAARVTTASETVDVNTFMVTIRLRNDVNIHNVRVSELPIGGADLLIGMDIITLGDFAITNENGKTTLSFRTPSMQTIDFVEQHKIFNNQQIKVGPNQPCPCGSGRKYKKCHGAHDKR